MFTYQVSAQTNVDSLKKTIQSRKIDSNYIKTLVAISQTFGNRNPDSSIVYADKAILLAAKINQQALVIPAYQYKAYAQYIKGDYTQALSDYKKMYAAAEKVGDNKNMAASINNQGNVFIELANYPEAINRYKEAIL